MCVKPVGPRCGWMGLLTGNVTPKEEFVQIVFSKLAKILLKSTIPAFDSLKRHNKHDNDQDRNDVAGSDGTGRPRARSQGAEAKEPQAHCANELGPGKTPHRPRVPKNWRNFLGLKHLAHVLAVTYLF